LFFFIGNFVPIKKKELNAYVRSKLLCIFLPFGISSKYTMILWSGCGKAAFF